MTALPDYAHHITTFVQTPAAFAFEKLSSAAFVGGWSLGSMRLTPVGNGVYRGVSLFDGAEAFVEIHPVPEHGLIDFSVGTLESRLPRIFIRVVSGASIGYDEGCSFVSLHAMRATTATDAAWARTCTVHETESLLIKAQLETEYAREVK